MGVVSSQPVPEKKTLTDSELADAQLKSDSSAQKPIPSSSFSIRTYFPASQKNSKLPGTGQHESSPTATNHAEQPSPSVEDTNEVDRFFDSFPPALGPPVRSPAAQRLDAVPSDNEEVSILLQDYGGQQSSVNMPETPCPPPTRRETKLGLNGSRTLDTTTNGPAYAMAVTATPNGKPSSKDTTNLSGKRPRRKSNPIVQPEEEESYVDQEEERERENNATKPRKRKRTSEGAPKKTKKQKTTDTTVVNGEREAVTDTDAAEAVTASPDIQITSERKKRRLPVIKPQKDRSDGKTIPRKEHGVSRSGYRDPTYQPALNANGQKSGMFSLEELKKAERFKKEYCAERGLDNLGFVKLVHANAHNSLEVQSFWNELLESRWFPDRQKRTLQRTFRRQFHTFEKRGIWTESEDERLKEAFQIHPRKWVKLEQILERHHEDIRDRWRNYHENGKSTKGEFTEEELTKLFTAIGQHIKLVHRREKKERERKIMYGENPGPAPDELNEARNEKLIHWESVAKKVGTRSRLQCQQKYKAMRDRGGHEDLTQEIEQAEAEFAALQAEKPPPLPPIVDPSSPPSFNPTIASPDGTTPSTRKTRRKEKKVASRRKIARYMKAGDKLDILQAICNSTVDNEEDIDWRDLGVTGYGSEEFREHWNRMDCKLTWLQAKDEFLDSWDIAQHDGEQPPTKFEDLAEAVTGFFMQTIDSQTQEERWDGVESEKERQDSIEIEMDAD
ncbi:RNA polymerase I enhancer binding protein [Agyrium rufum]|nr:RNA polymerase I enhancer binding protein [Agyrium rufum]